jgi:hypothetical protein
MSVERALQLLQDLATNLDFLAAIEDASPDERRRILDERGYSPYDVSAEDIQAAIGQTRTGTGLFQAVSRLPGLTHELRVYLAAEQAGDIRRG